MKSNQSLFLLFPLATSLTLPPSKPPPLVLLDRDGVLNQDIGSPGVLQPSQLKLTHRAARAVGDLRRAGCDIALVTNQSCIGKGLINQAELDEVHESLRRLLREGDEDALLGEIFCCTSLETSGDARRKPNPGMILEACRVHGVGISDCVFVGDTLGDLQAGASAEVPLRVLVETGYGLGVMNGREAPSQGAVLIDQSYCLESSFGLESLSSVLPFVYARDLSAAVDWLLSCSDSE